VLINFFMVSFFIAFQAEIESTIKMLLCPSLHLVLSAITLKPLFACDLQFILSNAFNAKKREREIGSGSYGAVKNHLFTDEN
jgi:hypothetical protein